MRFHSTCWSVVLLMSCLLCGAAARAEDSTEAKVVRAFMEAWHSGDVDRIMGFLAADCYYANHPSLTGSDPVVKGIDNIRTFLTPFFRKDPLTVPFKFHTEIVNVVGGAEGVAIERRDVFETGNLKHSVPVAGFFRVKDGKITYWVDYFDSGAFQPITTIMSVYARP